MAPRKSSSLGRVERLVRLEDEALHIVVMVVVMAVPGMLVLVRRVVTVLTVHMIVMGPCAWSWSWTVVFQEIGVDVKLGVEVEAAQVKHLGQC